MPFDFDAGALAALVSVVLIDLVLAGDNAVVIALAAARLSPVQRRRAIVAGVAIATALRIALSIVATRLLAIIGLTLAGGLLLLWVAWKLYRDLRAAPEDGAAAGLAPPAPGTFGAALGKIVLADLSMSLDNVLAVAGTAREHLVVLALGLLLSVALTALASSLLTRLLARYRWIAWLGLAIVTGVALRMIYDGSAEVIQRALDPSG